MAGADHLQAVDAGIQGTFNTTAIGVFGTTSDACQSWDGAKLLRKHGDLMLAEGDRLLDMAKFLESQGGQMDDMRARGRNLLRGATDSFASADFQESLSRRQLLRSDVIKRHGVYNMEGLAGVRALEATKAKAVETQLDVVAKMPEEFLQGLGVIPTDDDTNTIGLIRESLKSMGDDPLAEGEEGTALPVKPRFPAFASVPEFIDSLDYPKEIETHADFDWDALVEKNMTPRWDYVNKTGPPASDETPVIIKAEPPPKQKPSTMLPAVARPLLRLRGMPSKVTTAQGSPKSATNSQAPLDPSITTKQPLMPQFQAFNIAQALEQQPQMRTAANTSQRMPSQSSPLAQGFTPINRPEVSPIGSSFGASVVKPRLRTAADLRDMSPDTRTSVTPSAVDTPAKSSHKRSHIEPSGFADLTPQPARKKQKKVKEVDAAAEAPSEAPKKVKKKQKNSRGTGD